MKNLQIKGVSDSKEFKVHFRLKSVLPLGSFWFGSGRFALVLKKTLIRSCINIENSNGCSCVKVLL